MTLEKKTIALALTGSIAAYKAVEVARLCIKRGAKVLPIMTRSATQFVAPVTLSGICGEAVSIDMFDPSFSGEKHVSLADRADLVAIVPATADTIAKLATGRADDLVSALALCARGPIVLAPAMHPRMWSHPAVQANCDTLTKQGRVVWAGPVDGPVASGDTGMGRMAEPSSIAQQIEAALGPSDLRGLRIVITAGPTHEGLDPVRFLGNRSSGKMGFAIATRAAMRGADVTLIAGPVSLPTPTRVRRVDIESAQDMQAALDEALGKGLDRADVLIMAAAVADFRPVSKSRTKLKKDDGLASIALAQNPDLLRAIGHRRREKSPMLIGFALETGSDAAVLRYARKKLADKRVDLIVANRADESLMKDTNRVSFVSKSEVLNLPPVDKTLVADALLDIVRDVRDARAR